MLPATLPLSASPQPVSAAPVSAAEGAARPTRLVAKLGRLATAGVTAAALLAGAVSPAQALGKTERNILKGIAAAVVVQQMYHYATRGEAQQRPPQDLHPTYPSYPSQPAYPTYPSQPSYPSYQRSVAEQVYRDHRPEERRAIQRRLAAYGYYRGAIDGIWGRGTEAAVKRYANDIGGAPQLGTSHGVRDLYQRLMA